MSGSRSWREYISDAGVKYSLQVDESNANLITAFTQVILCPVRTSNPPPMPVGLTPRRVHCFAQYNPRIRRSFIVGNPSFYTSRLARGEEYIYTLTPGIDESEVNLWIITGYTGEKFSCPTYYQNADTGLIDGTPYMV
jgi:hypothetical protein